eukprot:CAMPEP_0184658598 /NCGR_PEP_ID=MMETSP0308-20130426/26104_1 /TAXON_ID=38269 /ORGANISM="Gloeochaete witrockiana, Strain SAG 46.84" /LENGTH=538 /DNA_ID=CAMNT_0027097721 /DNA_START=267 /DNA_END=1883 /DNA_ORIENTATION=-
MPRGKKKVAESEEESSSVESEEDIPKTKRPSKKRKTEKKESKVSDSEEETVGLSSQSVEKERIKPLNGKPVNQAGNFVLYWMQASVRSEHNPALEFAIQKANDLKKPLVAFFGITDNYPEANERSYAFMLEGLSEAQQSLKERGIQLVILKKSPELGAAELAEDACLLITDRGYLRIQRQWRQAVADKAPCHMVQVEGDVVVPVELVSSKEEYAARTIRPKIWNHAKKFLRLLEPTTLQVPSLDVTLPTGLDMSNVDSVLASLQVDRSVPRVSTYIGGTSQAKKWLDLFITKKLKLYKDKRNEPADDYVSHMSPYLHYGHISPVYIALEAMNKGENKESKDSFIEELIVRRELSMNFVFYNTKYDKYEGLPDWARGSMEKHAKDKREKLYTEEQLEQGKTYDDYWNASQKEMVITGKMHNYMRMYWGKKILEWTSSPQEAFRITLYLNNKYHLDGRDPNSFTGVAWIFGKHDRPWGPERPVFGLIRYMNAAGLKRKLKIEAYVTKVKGMESKLKASKQSVSKPAVKDAFSVLNSSSKK